VFRRAGWRRNLTRFWGILRRVIARDNREPVI
jgi:hypothetical protein